MRVVQCLSHSIESYDMLRTYARIGVEAFDIGGYIDPRHPHDPKRPAVPEMAYLPDLKYAVDRLDTADNLAAAQTRIPRELLDWLGDDGAIVFHHRLEERLIPQWPRLRDWMSGNAGRRVIWRSIGQSVSGNEAAMRPLIAEGLERVAYSPKEANIPGYTGHAAVIRFGKDPDEWTGWNGLSEMVLNITQHDATPHARDVWVNWAYWEEATRGLPTVFAGPHSEMVGGVGTLDLDDMKRLLRYSRAYLYTGTQPASYTLGLIEAMMTGIPVVSIGADRMRIFQYGPALFEGHEIAPLAFNDPLAARSALSTILHSPDYAEMLGRESRAIAIDLFGIDRIAAQWADFLGVRVLETVGGRVWPDPT